MITNEQVMEKLASIEALLQKPIINEHSRELWTIDDVAKYFGFSMDHTRRNVIASPFFPAAVAISGRTGGKSKDLYVSGEVVSFCLKHKKRKARI
ncbi:hypothetical protein CH625_002720 [Haemophilus influenzae]|uniref:hypothetical protein n=1 Tax=Haemophilus influenzae TaxID=727 RepID=UPI0005AEE3E4|nr:hypothetical protein [Haemophilus influenzae]AXP61871.1 hypothetical protein CH624_08235 [Haemophilus influenzae]KIP51222.1 hypothetical protein SU58_00075 [Haemophilus influenzae]KMZ26004.1 hypothetical protein ABN48_08885 [Haemophilus influenzae]MCK9681579.1 hypothetical protein [Haemophilus influenzae]RFN98612.1 hypothetical protein CH623_03000 [Haemophilus influenzae]